MIHVVMEYCEKGEILIWSPKTMKFKPFNKEEEELSEAEIKHYMKGCIKGLYYSKISTYIMTNFYSAFLRNRTQRHQALEHPYIERQHS